MVLNEYIREIIAEETNLPKKKWADVSLLDLSDRQIEALFAMYMISYDADFGGIGLHPKIQSKQDLHRYKLAWLIDVDEDPSPDAFIMYKETHSGKKITLIGTDGAKDSKREVVVKMVGLLGSSGWYAEVSGKPEELLRRQRLPYIDDEEKVKKILGDSKPFEWIGDGKYIRKVGGELGSTKIIFGKPTGA